MKAFIIFVVLIGFIVIILKYLNFRKKVHESRNQPGSGYGKRMGVFYLLTAFSIIFGLGAVLETYIVKIFHLKISPDSEKYMLIAFIVLTIGSVLILTDIKSFTLFNSNIVKINGSNNVVQQDVKNDSGEQSAKRQ